MRTKGTILLAVTGFDPQVWQDHLTRAAPDRPVITEVGDDADAVDYAVVWKQRPGVLNHLQNLKAIFSIGGGAGGVGRVGRH